MKRSAGVGAAALVLLIGSSFLVLYGVSPIRQILLVKSGVTAQVNPQGGTIQTGTLIFLYLICVAIGVWGISTAMGLFNLRAWARISVLAMGAVILFFSFAAGFVILVLLPTNSVPLFSPQDPPVLLIVTLAMFIIPVAIGLWWLLLFTRKSVKQQFVGSPTEPTEDASTTP